MKSLTSGSIFRQLISLSWPTMLAMVFQTGFNIVDMIFVGRISAEAIAAVSIAFPFIFLIFALTIGLGIGTSSLIARLIGAKDKEKTIQASQQAMMLATFFGIVFAAAGFFFAIPLISLISSDPNVMHLAVTYSKTVFVGFIFMFLFFAASSILRGYGDMKTPMKMMILATAINIILDPILIFGFGFIPSLGIFGAGLATVIARAVGCIWILYILFKQEHLFNFKFKLFVFDWSIIKDIFRIGLPSSTNHMLMAVGFFLFTKMASNYGPYAIAAFGIGSKIDSAVFMPIIGVSMAALTLIGQNFGAKKYERVIKTSWESISISALIMFLIGLMFWISPGFWISVFTKQPEVIVLGTSYIRIIMLVYAFVGVSTIIERAFQGIGRGYPALVITLLRGLSAIPLAYFFMKAFGVNGIWMGIAAGILISGIFSLVWFMLSFKKLLYKSA